jgi:peptidoglycan/LPS O-acetylase OafA/YrhL
LTAGTDLPPQLDAPLPAPEHAPSPAVAPPPGNPRFPLFDALRGLAVLAVVVYHVFVFTGALNRRGIGDAVAPPPGNPRFPLFDALRGLAVLAVVVYHVFVFTGALNRRGIGDAVAVAGSLGPILFFAISGFLLYRPWVAARAAGKPAPSTLGYARRRALRILPAYWFALTVLALFPGIAGVFSGDWWRYYFFLQLYDTDTLGLGIPVAWTLCVEVTFYLSLPLWALAARRRRAPAELRALGALALAGVAIQVAAGREAIPDVLGQSLLGQSTWFSLGMALAVVSVAGLPAAGRSRALMQAVADHPGLCVAGAILAFGALIPLRHQPGGLLGIVAALQTQQPYPKLLADIALTALVLALVLAPAVWDAPARLPQKVLAAAPLAWLGLISYGVYLWHLTIVELLVLPAMPTHFEADGLGLGERIGDGVTPIALALALAAACAVAAASYRWVELPFLRRKER